MTGVIYSHFLWFQIFFLWILLWLCFSVRRGISRLMDFQGNSCTRKSHMHKASRRGPVTLVNYGSEIYNMKSNYSKVNVISDNLRYKHNISFSALWNISNTYFVNCQERLKTIYFNAMPCLGSSHLSGRQCLSVIQVLLLCCRYLSPKVEPSLPKLKSLRIMVSAVLHRCHYDIYNCSF